METGERIRIEREKRGWTRQELADKASIPLRSLEKIEQLQVAEPKFADVATIAKALGLTCVDLLPNNEPSPEAAKRGRPKAAAASAEEPVQAKRKA